MKRRILLFSCLLATISIILTGVLFQLAAFHSYFEKTRQETVTEAGLIRAAANISGDSCVAALDKADPDLRITLISPDGEVIYDSDISYGRLDSHAGRPEFVGALENGAGESTRLSSTFGERTYYYAVLLDSGNVLRAARTVDSVFSSFFQILVLGALIAAIMTIAAIIVGARVTKSIVRPINQLDLDDLENNAVYEELSPLLHRMKQQNDIIAGQMAEIKQKQQEFAAITDNMREGLLVLDRDAYVLSSNKSALRLLDARTDGPMRMNALAFNRSQDFLSVVEAVLGGAPAEATLHINGKYIQIIANPVWGPEGAPPAGGMGAAAGVGGTHSPGGKASAEGASAPHGPGAAAGTGATDPGAPHNPSAPHAPDAGAPHAPDAGAPHGPDAGAPHSPGAPHAPDAAAGLGGTGAAAGALLMLLDVTEREDREKLRREFTANVSHELKTPLTSISGYAEIISEGLAKQEDIPRFAQNIFSESQRLITLIGDIMLLSKLDEGEKDSFPAREDIDIFALAEEVAQRFHGAAAKKGVKISLAGSSTAIYAVRQAIDEMIFNLIDNAIKYNREGGSAAIIVREADGMAVLSVADTGIGIPAHEQDRVFERFYRVEKSRSHSVEGTGLGLSIVKHAVMLHRGAIDIKSDGSSGTIITVSIPLPGA